MEYLDLLYILSAASIAYVGARMAASHRRFQREFEEEALVGFHDMAAAWRESRTHDAVDLPATAERQVSVSGRSATDLKDDLSRVQASLPRDTVDDTVAQREVRLATAALLSALDAHPDIFR